MGYRLRGPILELKENMDLVSSAVSFGTLQLLPGSELIALMADHQTTGGYPRVGHIISAHLPKFAQLRPGDSVRFSQVGLDQAEEMLFAQAREMKIIQRSCADHLKGMLC
jgi:antagonist of KipI